MDKQRVVLASGNKGKLVELQDALQRFDVTLIPQTQFGVESVEETGLSFVENAILKARHASKVTGLAALSDDSGLEVDALFGAPGIYSARFAGTDGDDEQNNLKLLAEMSAIPSEQRTARFHCVLVYLRHWQDPTPIICQGSWQGVIKTTLEGSGGFGYDPLFFVPSLNKSAAQLSKAEKNQMSHRGQAIKQLHSLFRL
ncbi:MAG: RdgB/HAM1 family non-canonical purine NTP pyrophosphatase [Bermanella sp.]|jgi:non-canonical purine NTP pyrophosphatase, rdgB/HAM1 family